MTAISVSCHEDDFCKFTDSGKPVPITYLLEFHRRRLCDSDEKSHSQTTQVQLYKLERFFRDLAQCSEDSCSFPEIRENGCVYISKVIDYMIRKNADLKSFFQRLDRTGDGMTILRNALLEAGITDEMLLEVEDEATSKSDRLRILKQIMDLALPKDQRQVSNTTWMDRLVGLLKTAGAVLAFGGYQHLFPHAVSSIHVSDDQVLAMELNHEALPIRSAQVRTLNGVNVIGPSGVTVGLIMGTPTASNDFVKNMGLTKINAAMTERLDLGFISVARVLHDQFPPGHMLHKPEVQFLRVVPFDSKMNHQFGGALWMSYVVNANPRLLRSPDGELVIDMNAQMDLDESDTDVLPSTVRERLLQDFRHQVSKRWVLPTWADHVTISSAHAKQMLVLLEGMQLDSIEAYAQKQAVHAILSVLARFYKQGMSWKGRDVFDVLLKSRKIIDLVPVPDLRAMLEGKPLPQVPSSIPIRIAPIPSSDDTIKLSNFRVAEAIGWGINESRKVRELSSNEIKYVMKPVDHDSVPAQFASQDMFHRLNFGQFGILFPATHVLEGKSLLTEWVSGAQTFAEYSASKTNFPQSMREQIGVLTLFDQLVRNCDRHHNNLLVKNDQLILIDHDLTFTEHGPFIQMVGDGILTEKLIRWFAFIDLSNIILPFEDTSGLFPSLLDFVKYNYARTSIVLNNLVRKTIEVQGSLIHGISAGMMYREMRNDADPLVPLDVALAQQRLQAVFLTR